MPDMAEPPVLLIRVKLSRAFIGAAVRVRLAVEPMMTVEAEIRLKSEE